MFDQLPIGNKSAMNVDEYPPDFNPDQLQEKKQPLPLGKRLASKVWKVKKEGLQELLKTNQFVEHESVIIKSLSDSNAQCQLLSLRILVNFLENQSSFEGDSKTVIKSVIEKIIVVEKEEMLTYGMEVLFWMFDHKYQQMIMNELNQYILNKNPKIVTASLNIIRILLNNYGLKKLGNLESFMKHFKVFAESVRPVAKAQYMQLFKQIFKWGGENALSQFIIHPQVKSDLTKWSKTYQMQPMQIKRGLKKGEQGKKVNPNQQQEDNQIPVDVLHPYDGRWVDQVLAVEKWKEKKEMLDEFIKKTKVKAIVPRQHAHYITLLKRLLSENNINLLQCAFKIIKNLCKGLKKHFGQSCRSFLSSLYLKLKDNKAMIVDETLETLKIMTDSITLEDMSEDIKEALKDKSPQMKVNTLKLLKEFCVKEITPKSLKILKSFLPSVVSLTNDGVQDVRQSAMQILCKIKENFGMLFFEDKLKGMPEKKLNMIRSIPSNQQPIKMKMEQTLPVMAPPPPPPVQVKPVVKVKSITKKTQRHTYSQNVHTNNITKPVKQKRQTEETVDVEHEQWPICPDSGHVLRLINLFTKLGHPFNQLATPFKLKQTHIDLIQNLENHFMCKNADVLLKWALWRLLIEDKQICYEIISMVLHLIGLLNNQLTDSQMLLVMSIISNSLEHNCISNNMLVCVNTSILQISDLLRDKMFNFWMLTLNQNSNNTVSSQKIIQLLKSTYEKHAFTTNELISMARIEAIAKNKQFVLFIIQKGSTKEILKVYGFTYDESNNKQELDVNSKNLLLKFGGAQFFINVRPEQKNQILQIFKKTSNEAMQEIILLENRNSVEDKVNLHIKIMDTIMIPYMSYSIQSINIYNYFKYLTLIVSQLCEPQNGYGEKITPHLRNLVRLLMFFLIDVSQSKLDQKDEVSKSVNKILLVLLENIQAEHLIDVMTLLLKYSLKNDLNKKLTQLLMKCIMKTTKVTSFQQKTIKNVKHLMNFFINLVNEVDAASEQPLFKSIKSLFIDLLSNFKQSCLDIVFQKLNQTNGIKNEQIRNMLKHFTGLQDQQLPSIPEKQSENNPNIANNQNIDNNNSFNQKSVASSSQISNFTQSYSAMKHGFMQYQKIKESTNLPKNNLTPLNSNELISIPTTDNPKALSFGERKRLQNIQELNESLNQLIQMKNLTVTNKKSERQELEIDDREVE